MKAHQRIIREKKSSNSDDFFELQEVQNLDFDNYSIKEVSYAEASSLILQYEWLGTMPSQLSKAVGLFFEGRLSAVECFTETRPAGKYTVEGFPAMCLARGACAYWCPNWASSKLISSSLKFLDAEKFNFCVAYSDTDAGEIGTVYQACNWTCLGPVSRGNKYWISPDGKRHDHERPRSVARSKDPLFKKTGKLNPEIVLEIKNQMIESGWKHVVGGVRYRYAMPLFSNKRQKKQRQQVLDKIKCPYPKRDNGLALSQAA